MAKQISNAQKIRNDIAEKISDMTTERLLIVRRFVNKLREKA